jgi:hypothetical protein
MAPTDQLPPVYVPPGGPTGGGFPPPPVGAKPVGTGLGTAALTVGIVAFVTGWIPFLAGLVAIAGIVLGILAIRGRRAPARSIVGLSLSGLALAFNVIISTILIAAALHGAEGSGNSGPAAPAATKTAPATTKILSTPCYAFAAPNGYINNQSEKATAACITTDQLWGEYNADGTVKNTGVGQVLGSVSVDPVSTVKSDEVNPGGTLEGMVGFLNTKFIPDMGVVIGKAEAVTVDGQPASLTRVTSTKAKTRTKALLVLRAPEPYQVPGEDVRFFLVSFVTPEDNGDAIIDAAVSSWKWK